MVLPLPLADAPPQLSMAGASAAARALGAAGGGGREVSKAGGAPDTAEVGVPPRGLVATAAGATPSWLQQSGPRRILAEFKAVNAALAKEPGSLGALRSVEMPGDDCAVWRLEVSGFDEDLPGARALNADLAELQRQAGGSGAITMEVSFPPTYPSMPFFLRVISPRCQMYTGHVTAGGSICVEALTNTGTPNSWQRDYTFEGILTTVLHNVSTRIIHPEPLENLRCLDLF